MKKLFFLLLTVFSIHLAKANNGIHIDNQIGCDMIVVLYAHDNTNTSCQYYISGPISIAANSSASYTWAQLSGLSWLVTGSGVPTTPDFTTIVIDAFRVDYRSNTGCDGNSAIVGICGPWNTNNTLPAGCPCNGDNAAEIKYEDDGTDYIIHIF